MSAQTQVAGPHHPPPSAEPFPPVTQLTIASLALVLIGGILIAAGFPGTPQLAAPTALLAGGVILAATSMLLLSRHRGFAWPLFLKVARWALLAYAVIAGMIEFSLIHNGATGMPLVVISLLLVMFALDVTLSISSTVARFQGTGAR